ncbi:up-regulator of cell proliferation-like [Gastrophryne carolinensis]
MALDVTARDTGFEDEDTLFELDKPEIEDFMEPSPSNASNPLDNLCEILRATDVFLQQEIVTKMAMCQFGVPLLLPASNGSQCTFMLSAMREIVKKWTSPSCKNSKGFLEDNLVNVSMPIVSFAKLGTCSLSKSKLLNHVLSPPELTHDFFVYSDMPGGNIPRRCSDGLVEISWYFPVGQKQLDIFSDPVAILNLRGDLEVHFEQFNFLTRISSAMFVFIETLNEGQCELVSKIAAQNRDLFFILNFDKNQDKETLEFLKSLSGKFELKKETFLIKSKSINDSQMVKALQARIRMVTTDTSKKLSLEQIADRATDCRFLVDENFGGCEKAKNAAMAISSRITNVSHYKKETMRLQEGFSKPLAKLEKELCRMRELGDQDVEEYKSQLQEKRVELRSQQRQQRPTHGIVQFLHIMRTFSKLETKVFLKWLKIQLDSLARHHLAGLNEEYRTKLKDPDLDAQELMKIDKKISDSSLGIEHFIRELGQMYELEHSLGKSKELKDLPGIAANLLLDGFPLELVDGDASNIPLQWISNVLTELDVITGGRCRMRVITILGVQSTGKSTLLNTMFGLQYPVASGRCTRGAFMTLLNAKNEFQEDLGCDYIMVIDTEGLKSMELASLEGSYEHDNELATLVVGLSDITIINMAMENTEEMKEILQIVVHAFLRMNEVGKKSSCHFVHQNVSDVSAHDKNRKARGKFLEQLNEMTKIAARMEKRSGVATFSDIIHCDIEKNSWYIPGLWYGIPPMACINLGYSDSIKELKRSVIGCLESMAGKPQNIPQFTEWVKSLWNAVKHEKFIFSFQNRMITEAYNQLCIQYSEWEWTFQKTIHEWMMRTETLIFNLPGYELGTKTWDRIREQMSRILDQEERVMSASLEQYYEHDCDNAHLLEMFRGDFIHSVAYLRKDLENTLLDKCERTIEIQKERCQIRTIQENYINILETRVSDIMENIRKNQYRVNEEQLKKEFEMIWEKAVSNLPNNTVKMRDIDMAILQQLKRAMKIDDCSVANRLENTKNLHQYKEKNILKKEYLYDHFGTEWERAESLVSSLLKKCDKRVDEIASTKRDFSEVYSQELLKIIDDGLDRLNTHHPTTKIFELDLKLHILGKVSVTFQKMHEDFVCCNDPRRSLEELKPQYFSMFKNTFEKRDESQRRAKQFCNICLMPAFVEHVNRYLGKEIVDDILQRNGPRELKSHKVLQLAVLKELLENGSPDGYEEYINNYESFIKQWISKKLNKHYEKLNTIFVLQARILQALISTIQRALYDPRVLHAKNISDFLEEFCNILKEDLVVPQNNLKVVVFQSGLNDTKQFVADVESYLPELEQQVKEEVRSRSVSTILSRLTLKPQDELFRKVMGCGQQCPFCKAPCEAGGADHQQHFASAHRPRGLARHMMEGTNVLDHSICSTNVISNKSFSSAETSWNPHLYKDYQQFYPNWTIHPDTGGNTSHYWKFVLKEFNDGFAQLYQAEPANVPKDWRKLTKERALQGLHS